MRNEMELIFDAISDNEGFARVTVAAFVAHLNPTLEELAEIIFRLVTSDTVYDFMRCIVENFEGLSKDFTKADTDTHYKDPQFFRLTEVSRKYGADFRSFWRDIDKARRNVGSENSKIVLVTATRSKGHEYDAVIVLDCYDTEWPNSLAVDIEEERRLAYVAMTRAKKRLFVSKAYSRMLFGTTNRNRTSRFF